MRRVPWVGRSCGEICVKASQEVRGKRREAGLESQEQLGTKISVPRTLASLPSHGVTRGASSLRGSHGRSTRRILRGRHHLPSQVAAATRSCDSTDLISSVMARSH